ncbi:hypothetical protein HAX54_008854 [Datura stramonium]|uniref:Uncharacterized protein n=1 Tax=Datura stramonium TaxID=4076 RepID=A0ABS8TGJ6_DATST|nr:hypothetical protein [Datura stramonium]
MDHHMLPPIKYTEHRNVIRKVAKSSPVKSKRSPEASKSSQYNHSIPRTVRITVYRPRRARILPATKKTSFSYGDGSKSTSTKSLLKPPSSVCEVTCQTVARRPDALTNFITPPKSEPEPDISVPSNSEYESGNESRNIPSPTSVLRSRMSQSSAETDQQSQSDPIHVPEECPSVQGSMEYEQTAELVTRLLNR